MTLGKKLKQTLDALEQAKVKALYDKDQADLKRINKEREALRKKLKGYRDSMVGQINQSVVPSIRIEDYETRGWIKKALEDSAPHQDLWYEVTDFFEKENLHIILNEQHDGVGIRDWSILSVRPSF